MTEYNAFGSATTTGQGAGAGAGLVWQLDSGAYTFGQRFRVDASGLSAVKVRFYVPAGSPNGAGSGYVVGIYDVGGSVPLQQAGPVSAVVGWNEVTITDVPLSLGADYMAAVLFPNGYYSAQAPDAVPWDPAGPLEFYAIGSFNSGGTLTYPSNSSGTNPSYGIDVTVSDGVPAGQDGAGTSASGSLSDSGSGSITYAGTGSSSSGALSDAGAGTQVYSGSGSSASGSLSSAGTGTQPLAGTGSSSSGVLTSSGVGTGPVAGASGTPMSARLAALWFTETLGIERYQGDTAYGPSFAASVDASGALDHGTKEVLTATGDTVISTARCFLSVDTDTIRPGSRVTLPGAHGGGAFIVIGVQLHRSGQRTPDHLELVLQ